MKRTHGTGANSSDLQKVSVWRKFAYRDTDEFVEMIDLFLKKNNFSYADALCERALEIHCNNYELLLKKAQILTEGNSLSKAMAILHKLDRLNPDDLRIKMLEGLCEINNNRASEAEMIFDTALSLFVSNRSDVLCHISTLFKRKGFYKSALKYILQAYDINPGDCDIILKAADLFDSLNLFEKSCKLYRKYLNINVYDEKVRLLLTLALYNIGDYQAAKDELDFTLDIKPDYPEALFAGAELMSVTQQYDQALKYLDELLILQPQNEKCMITAGDVCQNLDKFYQAIHYYISALKINRQNSESWYGLCTAAYSLNKKNLSINSINKALNINSDDARYNHTAAKLYFFSGDSAKADEYFKKSITDQDYCNFKLDYADFNFCIGKPDRAVKILSEVKNFCDCGSDQFFRFAAWYYSIGDLQNACNQLESGLKISTVGLNYFFESCPDAGRNENIINTVKKYLETN